MVPSPGIVTPQTGTEDETRQPDEEEDGGGDPEWYDESTGTYDDAEEASEL